MSKKFFVLSLSLMAVLLIVSSAMAMSYRYELNGSDDAVPEIFEDATEEGFAGYNYTAKYHLPALILTEFNANDDDDDGMVVTSEKYKISWKADAPAALSGLNFDFNAEASTLTIAGILPASDDTYDFSVIAEVSECDYKEAVGTRTSFDSEFKIYVRLDDHELISSGNDFDSCVKPAEKVELNKVTPGYSVTVRAPQRESHHEMIYSAYIEEENGVPAINLPEWLVYEISEKVKDSYGDEQIASVTITLKKDANVKPDTKAVVRVPFTVDNEQKFKAVGWDVTYTEEVKEEVKEEAKPQPKKGWFSW